ASPDPGPAPQPMHAVQEETPPAKRLLEGKKEVTFGFEGDAPYVAIFNDTLFQRQTASEVNETVYKEETDPKIRARLYRGHEIRATFDGLTFRRVEGRPDLVELVVVGPARTAVVKQR